MYPLLGHLHLGRVVIIAFASQSLWLSLAIAVMEKNGSDSDWSSMPNDQGMSDDDIRTGCINWQGTLVADGEMYVPNGNDMCMRCTCDKHFPIMCHSVACSPPLHCASPQLVKGACCEYICLDDGDPKDGNMTNGGNSHEKDDGESITNLSLRLIASTVTSFLVLALLLFMVHRLRQRRLLLAMRRFEARAREGHTEDTDSEPYIPDAFLSLECPPYTDPPPPYSPPKPPQILPGEQPPPYDEINHSNNGTTSFPDENRNDVQTGDGCNVARNSGQGAQAASRNSGTIMDMNDRNNHVVENVNVCRSSIQRRSCDQSNNGMHPGTTLSAYASTDVVEGLGVVISPGSDLVSYGAGWSPSQSNCSEERQGGSGGTVYHRRALSSGDQPRSPSHPSQSRVQTVPTTTAFQRFSNIFKRESWKAKHRRRHGRPASHYSTPTHYATVPRNELHMCSDRSSNLQAGDSSIGKTYGRRPQARMCLSYDSSQAAYTLGAISPSTCSSTSSNSTESCDYYHNNYSNNSTSSTFTSASPHTNSNSMLTNSAHRQRFCDDLRRHLPPLQLSDMAESATPDSCNDGDQTTSEKSNYRSHQISLLEAADSSREGNVGRIRPQMPTPNIVRMQSHPVSSSSESDCTNHQPLASFIMSHPTPPLDMMVEHTDQTDNSTNEGNHPLPSFLPSGSSLNVLSAALSPLPEQNSNSYNCGKIKDDHGISTQAHSALFTHNMVSSCVPTIPSPSPSPPTPHNNGALRRSQSGASQASMFSVCSETGEKKLRVNGGMDEDTKVITADSHYPDFRSVPRSRQLLVVNAPVEECSQYTSVTNNYPSGLSHFQQDQTSVKEAAGGDFDDRDSLSVMPVNTSTVSSTRAQRYDLSTLPPSDRDNYKDSNAFNFNTAPLDKYVRGKDLSTCDNNSMTQSVNIPPLSPFVTSQSGKLIPSNSLNHNVSAVATGEQPISCSRAGKKLDVVKKHRKKKAKDRISLDGQMYKLPKPQHSSTGLKPVFVSIGEMNEERYRPQNAEGTSKDSETNPAWSRTAEKKSKVFCGLKRPPVRSSEPNSCNKIMTRSADDAHALYGNADVYRGVRGDSMCASATLPDNSFQYSGPLMQQAQYMVYDGDKETGLNNLNEPPSYLQNETLQRTFVTGTNSGRPDQSLQAKKKLGHKRQLPGNENSGHVSSSVCHKSRPKSFAALDNHLSEKSPNPFLFRPSSTTGETVLSGKGAKSGFGHDLNFDDQAGQADFHMRDVDFTAPRKYSGQDSHHQPNHLVCRKMSDSGNTSVNVNKTGASVGGYMTGSRSGLSHDLSFTSRPIPSGAHINKKRQSLLVAINGLATANNQERVGANADEGARRRHSDVHEGQVKGEKTACPAARRQERSLISDDYSEATSYV